MRKVGSKMLKSYSIIMKQWGQISNPSKSSNKTCVCVCWKGMCGFMQTITHASLLKKKFPLQKLQRKNIQQFPIPYTRVQNPQLKKFEHI